MMSQTKRTTKLLILVLAAVIALCAVLLVGCYKDADVRGETYYLYDESEGTFDERESLHIDGEKCIISIKGEDGMKDLVIDGKVTYEDNKVSGSGGIIVTKLSDFLARDGLDDLYEELGVTKLDMDFTANIKCEFTGIKYSNAIVVTNQSMTIRGFTGLLSMFNGTQSSSAREVYCKKGQTPDFSVNITIDCNGGVLDGKSTVVMRTDKTGRLELSNIEPLRDDYAFIGFSYYKDFNGYVFRDYITSDEDKTIYAYWREIVVVSFDINSTEYKIDGDSNIRVAKGVDFNNRPKIVPIVANPTTRFKDWYEGDERCFRWIGGTRFYEDTTIRAEWYGASEVSAYNNSLSTVHGDSNFIIHYMPKDFDIDTIGWYGGSSLSFGLYSVKDGQKDIFWGGNSGSFSTTDKTGKIFKINYVGQAYSGDVCLVIRDNGQEIGSVVIPVTELGVTGNQFQTHIFLDENNLNTYRVRW